MGLAGPGRSSRRQTVPFLRVFVPMISGLLLEYYTPIRTSILLSVFLISIIILIIYNGIPYQIKFRAYCVYGIVVQPLFFSLGSIIMQLHLDKPLIESGYTVNPNRNFLLIHIITAPIQRKSSFKSLAIIECLVKNDTCFYQNEKVLIYFKGEKTASRINTSSWIITDKVLQPVENFKSQGFDYKKYCRLRHIYSQLYLRENDFSVVPHADSRSVSMMLDSLRKNILSVIKKWVSSKSENGLLEALMVGFTDDLDPVLLKSYADTGVVHIIAISGLHLALICQFLQFVLVQRGKNRYARWAKFIVILSCLWCYSLLSGASPSVIRAAAMFSITLLARNIFRETNLYNILAASAFLLLCFDPFWIFDTGFQLSYAAVLSLGLFSNKIRELLPLQNKMLSALWDATSVSIAAQILTTPISIYYFNRFPAYFLIANLLAVPLSSLVLAGGILLCVCNPIDPLARLVGWILGMLITVLNGFIAYLSGLPGAVIGNLQISFPGVIMLYVLIFFSYHFVKTRKNIWLFAGLGTVAVYFCVHSIKQLTLS